MANATYDGVPSMERTWSASSLRQTFSEAAAVQPLPVTLGRLVDELQTALTPSAPKLDLLQPSEAEKQDDVAPVELVVPVSSEPSSPSENRRSTSSLDQPHTFTANHSSNTLSVLSAAAASLKDKTHQVAQQQKRALSVFQQKGGLVSWLHGEMDESVEHEVAASRLGKEHHDSSALPRSATSLTTSSLSSFTENSPPNLPSPIESPATKSTVEKSVGRRRSLPNVGSSSLFENFFDKVAGVTTLSTAPPPSSCPQAQAKVKLRPTVATEKSKSFSLDDFVSGKQADNPTSFKTPSSPEIGRPRAATTNVTMHLMMDVIPGTDDFTSPVLLKARSAASLSAPRLQPVTRFSLDDVLSDEWSCTVLWAHLYSSAASRDRQHHQRLSFLLETTFRITPLYRKLAGSDEATSDKEIEVKKLVTRLKRLHSRFLVHNGAATSGVPVASPAASHAKNQLSVAVHTLTDQRTSSNELAVAPQVENAVAALFRLAREVEREFRVIGTRSYASFADTALYRDFIARKSGLKSISALLRAAGIPFYQPPNVELGPVCLKLLTKDQSEDAESVFSRAGCQVFILTAESNGAIKFVDISPHTSGDDAIVQQTGILHTIESFLNPSANIHPAASKPLAFNFTAGSGINVVYGAVMWLPVGQSNALGADKMPGGICIISRFSLVDSMRHFLNSLWKDISSNIDVNDPDAVLRAPAQVARASVAMQTHFLAHQHEVSSDSDQFPVLDFKLDDLFDSLSLTNVLRLFALTLLEKKIILVASSYTILFSVGEALRALLHPLVWSHVYVPVLPLALKDCLQCPTPFLFGLHDAYVRRSEIPRPSNDLVVVNLDRDSLTGGGDVFLPPVRHSMMREELFRLRKPHLASRDTVDNFNTGNCVNGAFPTTAVRRVFHRHLQEILTSLEPCVNRFKLNGQCASVVDTFNTSVWSADTARFCAAMLHTQALSTYLASPRPDEITKVERIFV